MLRNRTNALVLSMPNSLCMQGFVEFQISKHPSNMFRYALQFGEQDEATAFRIIELIVERDPGLIIRQVKSLAKTAPGLFLRISQKWPKMTDWPRYYPLLYANDALAKATIRETLTWTESSYLTESYLGLVEHLTRTPYNEISPELKAAWKKAHSIWELDEEEITALSTLLEHWTDTINVNTLNTRPLLWNLLHNMLKDVSDGSWTLPVRPVKLALEKLFNH